MKTPIKAIREFCKHCMGEQPIEVKACTKPDCALWYYRLGKRPTKEFIKKNPYLQSKYFEKYDGLTASEFVAKMNKKR